MLSSGSVGVPTAHPLCRNPHSVLCVPAWNSPTPTEPTLPHRPATLPSLETSFCAQPPCFWASKDAGAQAEDMGRAAGSPWTTQGPPWTSEEDGKDSAAQGRVGEDSSAQPGTVRRFQCHTMSPVPWHVQDGATAHTALQPPLSPDVEDGAGLPGTNPASCSLSFPGYFYPPPNDRLRASKPSPVNSLPLPAMEITARWFKMGEQFAKQISPRLANESRADLTGTPSLGDTEHRLTALGWREPLQTGLMN